MNEQLLSIADRAVQRAESIGADQAEAYVASSKAFSIDVENSAIKTAAESRDAGCGIRAVVGKKIGFAYVTNIEDKYLLEAAEKAVKLAKISLPDPDFVSLPSCISDYPEVDGLFDQSVLDLTSEEAASLIIRTVDATKEQLDGYDFAIEASLSSASGHSVICNSLGISCYSKGTSVFMFSYPSIKHDGEQTSSFEYQVSRKRDLEPEWIGRRAAEKAVENLGGKTGVEGTMPVVLTPLAVGTILGYGLGGALNAEEVQYGRSYISDCIGEQIAADTLHVIDDAVLESGIRSRMFDAEGLPSQTTPLLEGGVLKSYLHNSYTANKDDVKNTANASRPSYSGLPSISASNFVIRPDKGSMDDLVSEMERGVVCRNTGDRPNMTTGDLSAMVMEGFYVEDGEIKHPLKNTLIGINMLDLLMNVSRIGDDIRATSSVVSPSIMIGSARVTSG